MEIVLNSLKHNGSFQEWFYCKFKEKDNVCGNMLWEGITSMTNTSYSQQNMFLSLHSKSSEKLCLKDLGKENFLAKRTFIFNYLLHCIWGMWHELITNPCARWVLTSTRLFGLVCVGFQWHNSKSQGNFKAPKHWFKPFLPRLYNQRLHRDNCQPTCLLVTQDKKPYLLVLPAVLQFSNWALLHNQSNLSVKKVIFVYPQCPTKPY